MQQISGIWPKRYKKGFWDICAIYIFSVSAKTPYLRYIVSLPVPPLLSWSCWISCCSNVQLPSYILRCASILNENWWLIWQGKTYKKTYIINKSFGIKCFFHFWIGLFFGNVGLAYRERDAPKQWPKLWKDGKVIQLEAKVQSQRCKPLKSPYWQNQCIAIFCQPFEVSREKNIIVKDQRRGKFEARVSICSSLLLLIQCALVHWPSCSWNWLFHWSLV